MFRTYLVAAFFVIVAIGQTQAQQIFGGASIAEASLTKDEPQFRMIVLKVLKSRVTVPSFTKAQYEIDGVRVVEYRPAKSHYPIALKTRKETIEINPRRYLFESLDGKPVKKETFVKMLKARRDGTIPVLMLEGEREISALERELLNRNLIVLRVFDMTVRWHHGTTRESLPPATRDDVVAVTQ